MSLRRFLNVAYAIWVEEYQRIGTDLLSTLEKLSEWAEGDPEKASTTASSVAAAKNQAAISELSGMLSGVQGAPRRRRARG